MDLMKNYVKHLEYLRKEHSIRTEDFIEGICSPRQWTRYKSGENLIPQDRFKSLCFRLGISPTEFEVSYEGKVDGELKPVFDLDDLINARKWEQAREKIEELRGSTFVNPNNETFFEFLQVMFEYHQDKIPHHYALDLLSKNIDYPNCLNKKKFTFIEFLHINRIAELETKFKKATALEFMYNILFNTRSVYLSSETKDYIPTFYHQVSKSYFLLDQIVKSFDVAQAGIKYSLQVSDMKMLEKLYYIESYIYDMYNRKEESLESAKKCIATCIAKNDYDKVDFYNKMFFEEQGFKIEF